MSADFTGLQAKVSQLQAKIDEMEPVVAQAKTLLANGPEIVKAEVAKAIQADDDIDNAAIGTVSTAIDAAFAKLSDEASTLSGAVSASTPASPAPPSEPPAEPAS